MSEVIGENTLFIIGKFGKTHGVKGWIRVISATSPPENIFELQPWFVKRKDEYSLLDIVDSTRQHGHAIVKVAGVDSVEDAKLLTGLEIAGKQHLLPELDAGEYYWRDLQGLQVQNLQGHELGKVSHLFETGANDVLVVKGQREYLIPFITEQFIKDVNVAKGTLLVDWDVDF